ncbi:hypothetical protein [Paenibacillus hubeiensis]|uniref:hypothetical protein n=1 Tax=Paenibacillus hubeiensis TaxID=3077330 RepID=UPI0031B9BD70
MSRRIENDEQLVKAIQGMQRLTEEIENPDPLGDGVEKQKLILERTAELVQIYSRGREVQTNPTRAAYYDQMGWAYQDFSAPVSEVRVQHKPNTKPQPETVPAKRTEPQRQQTKVSSWLDD